MFSLYRVKLNAWHSKQQIYLNLGVRKKSVQMQSGQKFIDGIMKQWAHKNWAVFEEISMIKVEIEYLAVALGQLCN